MEEIMEILANAGLRPVNSFVRDGEAYFLFGTEDEVRRSSPLLAEFYDGHDIYIDRDVTPHVAAVVTNLTAQDDWEEDEYTDEEDMDEEDMEGYDNEDYTEEFEFSDEDLDALEFGASVDDEEDDEDEVTAAYDYDDDGPEELSEAEVKEIVAFFGMEDSFDEEDLVIEASANETYFSIGDTFADANGTTVVVASIDEDTGEIGLIERDEDGDETDRAATSADALVALLDMDRRFKVPTDIVAELRTLESDLREADMDEEADEVASMLDEVSGAVNLLPKPTTIDPEQPSQGTGGPEGRPPDFGGSYGSASMNVAKILKQYGFKCSQKDGVMTAENDDMKLMVSVCKKGGMQAKCAPKTAAKGGKHPLSRTLEFELPEELEAFVESMGYTKTASVLLANPDDIKVESAAQVDLILHDKDEKPFWNVIVSGMPVGQIHLEDQPRADEIADMFITDTFASGLRSAMARMGAYEMLEHHNTRFYAAKVVESDLAQSLEEQMEEKYGEKFEELRDNWRDSFKNTARVAMAGLSKNWWRDEAHPLKAALYEEMAQRGVRDKTAIIEAAFEAGADALLDAVVKHTYDLMDMEPEAYRQVAAHIVEGSVIQVEEREEPVGKSYSQKLAAGNMPIRTGSTFNGDSADMEGRARQAIRSIRTKNRRL